MGALPRSHSPGSSDVRQNEPELNYVYFQDDNHTSMSGDTRDIERARRFKQAREPVLWFRDGGQEYILRDPAVLKQAEATWRPVVAIPLTRPHSVATSTAASAATAGG